jgi:hypothetical protein
MLFLNIPYWFLFSPTNIVFINVSVPEMEMILINPPFHVIRWCKF